MDNWSLGRESDLQTFTHKLLSWLNQQFSALDTPFSTKNKDRALFLAGKRLLEDVNRFNLHAFQRATARHQKKKTKEAKQLAEKEKLESFKSSRENKNSEDDYEDEAENNENEEGESEKASSSEEEHSRASDDEEIEPNSNKIAAGQFYHSNFLLKSLTGMESESKVKRIRELYGEAKGRS